MAGKRAGLALATGLLTLLGTIPPKGNLETIVAQDTKQAEEKVALSTYQQISQNFYEIGEEFYKKAKNKDKALESLGIASYFDPSNKQITDLIQKVDKDNKLKKNERESKKVEEKYTKTKNETIETLYQNGVEKAKTNKDEAQDIFYTILQIDKNSTKFDEALEKELGWKKVQEIHNWIEITYLLPPEIANAREKGMKYLNEASEGEKCETKDELPDLLNLENQQIYRRKSKDIVVRSTLDETSAKSTHKSTEGAIRLTLDYFELSGKPPFNIRDEKTTESHPFYKVTLLGSKAEQEKYGKDLETRGGTSIGGGLEKWTSEKDDKIFGFGHWMWIQGSGKYLKEYNDDRASNLTIENILRESSNYFDTELLKNSPWLGRFFIYNFTWQLLGTTYDARITERTDKYEGRIEKVSGVKSPVQMRAGAYFLAKENKLLPFNMFSRLKLDQFTDQAKATAWAATEYLIHNHKDKLVELLTDEYHKKTDLKDLSKYEIIEKHFGMTPEQFDKNVQEFVKKNYAGYRNYKEN